MKPIKIYYHNEEVKTIFTLPDKNKVDLHIKGGSFLKNVDRAELFVRHVDVEQTIAEYENKIEAIKELIA